MMHNTSLSLSDTQWSVLLTPPSLPCPFPSGNHWLVLYKQKSFTILARLTKLTKIAKEHQDARRKPVSGTSAVQASPLPQGALTIYIQTS